MELRLSGILVENQKLKDMVSTLAGKGGKIEMLENQLLDAGREQEERLVIEKDLELMALENFETLESKLDQAEAQRLASVSELEDIKKNQAYLEQKTQRRFDEQKKDAAKRRYLLELEITDLDQEKSNLGSQIKKIRNQTDKEKSQEITRLLAQKFTIDSLKIQINEETPNEPPPRISTEASMSQEFVNQLEHDYKDLESRFSELQVEKSQLGKELTEILVENRDLKAKIGTLAVQPKTQPLAVENVTLGSTDLPVPMINQSAKVPMIDQIAKITQLESELDAVRLENFEVSCLQAELDELTKLNFENVENYLAKLEEEKSTLVEQ